MSTSPARYMYPGARALPPSVSARSPSTNPTSETPSASRHLYDASHSRSGFEPRRANVRETYACESVPFVSLPWYDLLRSYGMIH